MRTWQRRYARSGLTWTILTPNEATEYYKWWKSVVLDKINVVTPSEPWGFTQPQPAATAAPKPAPKPTAIPPAKNPIAHERPKIEPLKREQPKITPLKSRIGR